MGTRERRQRQFGERERLILHAARDLIREEGLLSLQMVRLAERCEYAVGTLYQHFRSKEDLLLALTQESASRHAELCHRLVDWTAASRDRMLGVGVADMIFVKCNPEHFRVAQYAMCEAVWNAASDERRMELLATHDLIHDSVNAIVEDAVRRGDLDLRGLSGEQLIRGCAALTFGTHNMVHARGVIRDVGLQDPYRFMCRDLQALLNGYGWRPLADVTDMDEVDRLVERISREVFGDLHG